MPCLALHHPSRTLHVRHSLGLCLLVVLGCAGAPVLHAQQRLRDREDAAPVGGVLTLDDVVRRALRDNPDVRIATAAADAARGIAISASGVFDPVLTSAVSGGRDNTLRLAAPVGSTDLVRSSSLSNRIGYSVGAQQRLKYGLLLTPQISLAQTDVPGVQPLPQTRASVNLGVQIPLIRDVFGAQTRDVVTAAATDATAAEIDVQTSSATTVLSTVAAYWAYAAARERLMISADAEARAGRVLEETEALVRGDERPASDLIQLRGALNTARASRITAEQSALESWQTLALALALGPDALVSPPQTGTAFPLPPANDPAVDDSTTAATGVREALRRRPDALAIGERVSSARYRAQAARRSLRPDINLTVSMGYAGLNQGWGPGNFFSPMLHDPSGLNGSLQLNVGMPVQNSDARGRAAQADAVLRQQTLAARVVERRVEMGVTVATLAVRRARQSLHEATLATASAREVVENERRKFQLGLSTVFDIILAENSLTNALLAEVGGRQAYAVTLARVRLERGVLVTGNGRQLQVDLPALLQEHP